MLITSNLAGILQKTEIKSIFLNDGSYTQRGLSCSIYENIRRQMIGKDLPFYTLEQIPSSSSLIDYGYNLIFLNTSNRFEISPMRFNEFSQKYNFYLEKFSDSQFVLIFPFREVRKKFMKTIDSNMTSRIIETYDRSSLKYRTLPLKRLK